VGEACRIYNLFPRLAGPLDAWPAHAERAARLGFNWVFINPVQQPGFSGSLYSLRDHYRINRDFLPPGHDGDGRAELTATLGALRGLGLHVMIDLVVNHTAIDSPLLQQHPAWYRWTEENGQREVLRPFAVDPDDPNLRTVWGDLAEIDNVTSPERDALWDYWDAWVADLQALGFEGFRCDAAYKVPAALWRRLTRNAQARRPGTLFCAETLGCRPHEVQALHGAGFDLLFNSSKYWNFDSSWALEQHERYQTVAPSISFPESHDTERLAAWCDGRERVMCQRYAFAAAFSQGVMAPIGFEFGFRRPLHVVESRPEDWESPSMDLSDFLRRVNGLKQRYRVLGVEGRLEALGPLDRATLLLKKRDPATGQAMLLLINKDWHQSQEISLPNPSLLGSDAPLQLHRILDGGLEPWPGHGKVWLRPAEIVYALPQPE